MSTVVISSDDDEYPTVQISYAESDAHRNPADGDDTEIVSPGCSTFMLPFPGEPPAKAVYRLKGANPSMCVRHLDNCHIAFYSVPPGEGGRLRIWTSLEAGQAVCWDYDGIDAERKAVRIADYLTSRGYGRFVIIDEGERLWVRRIE